MEPVRGLIVGREAELAAVQCFVGDHADGPASLTLTGEAGIGKTAIWAQALLDAEAAGVAVRACRCSQSDAPLSFAGLGDLLDGLDPSELTALPAVQQEALSAALLVSDDGGREPGSRVVGVALLGVLRALARSGPVLLAVDDVQWLDASSSGVLSFALRRLDREPVRLITSFRTGTVGNVASDLGVPGERLVVGPVSVGIMQRIVQTRLSQTLARPTLTRLHRATGGNPMMCLEMARALQRRGTVLSASDPLPVPADLRVLVTERLRGLAPQTLEALLMTAALAQPTVTAVAAAVGDAVEAERFLEEAVTAGVLEVDGERVRFTHPLIASIPYADLSPAARRALHERLATTVTDPEEHARHAALGSDEPSSVVAAALDSAARHARRRGSIDAAAELAQLALSRTPASDPAGQLRRTVDTARYLFLLGDPARARALLAAGLDAAPPGPARVDGLLLGASIASWESGDATVAHWCEQALGEAGQDALLLARSHATFAETSPSGAAVDLFHAEAAVELLETMIAPPGGLMANALTNVAMHRLRLGRGLAVSTLERAVALQAQAEPVPVSDRAGLGLGMYLKVVDRFEESRAWLEVMRTCAVDEGDDSALPITLGHLAALECWAGEYDLAIALAREGREHAERMGIRAPMPASVHVLALAHQGHVGKARALGERDLAADQSAGFLSAVALDLRSLGTAELMAGDVAAAADHLLRALSISSEEIGINEPALLRVHPDAVEALVALARFEEAEKLTGQLDAATGANHHPWSTVMAARCHGLLKAADGDRAAAIELLERALADHQRLPMPFEEARTRLLLGSVLRRAGRRADARRELETARAMFLRLRTPIQERQASTELDSIGGRRRLENELTSVEQRIADLVAAGQTNREVAAAMFTSVRTVESHLGRIYRKLGIRSRTELAARSSSRTKVT
ncbi:MAG TPA: AAA family ATPase [Streptosporangiaceae bacterium]|nr:AAA family ATPase [Streptosporangiaceae bacterium]